MKSPAIKLLFIYPGVDFDDEWCFGYSVLDNEHIAIWKNGVKRKACVVDVGEKDGTICSKCGIKEAIQDFIFSFKL